MKKQIKPISTFEDLVLVLGLTLAALVVASVPVVSATAEGIARALRSDRGAF